MSQYDFTISYIHGENNTVADALSHLPITEPEFVPDADAAEVQANNWSQWLGSQKSVNAVLNIEIHKHILDDIKLGYSNNEFCKKFVSGQSILPNVKDINGLWYIGDQLLIPRFCDIHEHLFHLVHDSLGHAGLNKAYAALHDSYYWPNMCQDLEQAYIPACLDCLHNKSPTTKPTGPLHPLATPKSRGDSVAIDFIGLLPEDSGFNCIATFTDRLGSDVQIVPTWTNITAEDFTSLFFNKWYCENGLPLSIVSDRDKIFVSKFWKALNSLTGVRLDMSSSFHPQTDGSSERSNKTVNQAIRYHVNCNQKGWVSALPIIRFNMMNTVCRITSMCAPNFGFHLDTATRC